MLKCTNLSIGYDGKSVLKNISFELNAGDYLCILGHNGSGKSTLMKTILGLLKPVSGTVEFEKGFSAKEIGYLPQQNAFQKNFPASVFEIVLSGCQNKLGFFAFYNDSHKKRAWQNLERLGISAIAEKSFSELSGGQRQRVLLARALCAAEKMILLDEPVTGLDPKATEEMYGLIEALNKDGMTVIMISHDLDASAKYAGHILQLNRTEGTVTWQK